MNKWTNAVISTIKWHLYAMKGKKWWNHSRAKMINHIEDKLSDEVMLQGSYWVECWHKTQSDLILGSSFESTFIDACMYGQLFHNYSK